MILEAAIIKLTRNLDLLIRSKDNSISSHSELKEKAVICLDTLIKQAPDEEFANFVKLGDHEILLGYLFNTLCTLAKDDKSRSIRLLSLNTIQSTTRRLKEIHNDIDKSSPCSVNLLRSALPGVASSLFKLILSDTKLPKSLIVTGIETLADFIAAAFTKCKHEQFSSSSVEKIDEKQKQILFLLEDQNLIDICDNLSVRISYLINYAMSHHSELATDVYFALINLCHRLINETCQQFVRHAVNPVVRYVAFIKSRLDVSHQKGTALIKLRATVVMDSLKASVDRDTDLINCVIMSSVTKVIENLEEHCFTMLQSEREAEISMLNGYLDLMTPATLTSLFEFCEKRAQILDILTKLCEFSTSQPFLFLTDVKVNEDAIESTLNKQIYTADKRFAHMTSIEIQLISSICNMVGHKIDWLCLNDMLCNDLRKFDSSSNLYITQLIIQGCLTRRNIDTKLSRFAYQNIQYHVQRIEEIYLAQQFYLVDEDLEQIEPDKLLAMVLAIETLSLLVRLLVRFNKSDVEKTLTLRMILCPLLNWCSSPSRAVSEAALNALTQISIFYEFGSVKSMIGGNIDYIVDGVSLSIDNFTYNPEITSVLAIALKLSSIETFYYFSDIYERIFKLSSAYYHTNKSRHIALLFYRSLSIVADWLSSGVDIEPVSLNDEKSIESIRFELDLERRFRKLRSEILIDEQQRLDESIDNDTITEAQVIDEIRSGKVSEELEKANTEKCIDEDKPKLEQPGIKLTENILTHCISFISSNCEHTKILALKSSASAMRILAQDENTLLPLVHQLWAPLTKRLTADYRLNIETSLCAFECLMAMSLAAKDFIKRRTLDTIIPRMCMFIESQAVESKGKPEYGPYCMTVAYKCQLAILRDLGQLAWNIRLGYQSLWRVIKAALVYLDPRQIPELREAARASLHFMIALDSDCVWYFAEQSGYVSDLQPLAQIYSLMP